jgi:hypothetical protein
MWALDGVSARVAQGIGGLCSQILFQVDGAALTSSRTGNANGKGHQFLKIIAGLGEEAFRKYCVRAEIE